jgi:hypothetical protein
MNNLGECVTNFCKKTLLFIMIFMLFKNKHFIDKNKGFISITCYFMSTNDSAGV